MCPSKESYPQQSVSTVPTQEKKRPARISSKQNANFWIFTKKEIEKMPQKYKKSFIVAEQRVFYRIKVTGVYEARYKRKAEGIKIEVSALTLEELKLKFIQALHDCITGTKTSKRKKTPENTLFMSYVYEWLEEKRRSTKEGKAFTPIEEATLIDYCIKNQTLATTSALLLLLLFGLRQSELLTLNVVDNQWLECTTSKSRFGHDKEIRKIPFTPVARRFLSFIDFEKAKNTNLGAIKSTIRRLFPEHHPHELRYTFITRCKECGVNPELVMLWDGHEMDDDVKTSKVDRGYTDYSDEYQLQEAEKVNYKIPTETA